MISSDCLAIGIDIGTTNSCIAVFKNKNVELIPNEKGKYLTPSVVKITSDKILVGEDALQNYDKDENVVYSVKRLIGRKIDDKDIQNDIKKWPFKVEPGKNNNAVIKINNKIYTPEQITSFIVKKLVNDAERKLGKDIKFAVITVPANFNNSQREATRKACESIKKDFKILRIINEPTAAALAYGFKEELNYKNSIKNTSDSFDKKSDISISSCNTQNISIKIKNKNVLVFDLGGGTFDITLLLLSESETKTFSVFSTNGDTHLGGDDLDQILVDYCIEKFCEYNFKDIEDVRKIDKWKLNLLRLKCEKAKRFLSENEDSDIILENFYDSLDLNLKIKNSDFCININSEYEKSLKNLQRRYNEFFEKLIKPLDKILEDSKLEKNNIDDVILVGGSAKLPKIKDIIKNYFGRDDIIINEKIDSINQSEAVAFGASIEAAKILRNHNKIIENFVLLDVNPLTLGISVVSSKEPGKLLMSPIIKKGSHIPIQKDRDYFSSVDNATKINIDVYEGEGKYVEKKNLLGKYEISNLKPLPKGKIKIKVIFKIDEDGIFKLIVKEDSNGTTIEKEIKRNNEFDIKQIPKTNSELISFPRLEDIDYFIEEFSKADDEESKYDILQNLINELEEYIRKLENMDKSLINESIVEEIFEKTKMLFNSYRELLSYEITPDNEKNEIIASIKIYIDKFIFQNGNYIRELIDIFSTLEEKFRKYFRDLLTHVIKLYQKEGNKIYMVDEKNSIIRNNAVIKYQNAIYFKKYIKSNAVIPRELRQAIIDCEEKTIQILHKNSDENTIKAKASLYPNRNDLSLKEIYYQLNKFNDSIKYLEDNNISHKKILNKDTKLYEKNIELLSYYKGCVVNIKSTYLKHINTNLIELRDLAEESYFMYKNLYEKDQNKFNEDNKIFKKKCIWAYEIKLIYMDLDDKVKKNDKKNLDEFEKQYKIDHKNIFEEIDKKFNKGTTKEFIEFILNKHPYKNMEKSELSNIPSNNDLKKNYLTNLLSKYHPNSSYNLNTKEEKSNYVEMHYIFEKLSELESTLF